MGKFVSNKSFEKLRSLAERAPKLNQEDSCLDKRVSKYISCACGLKLLYGFEKINDKILGSLFDLAKEANAVEKMKEMQEGEIVNKIENTESENRPALHTSLRDFFENSSQDDRAREARDLAFIELEKLKKFIDQLQDDKYDTIVQIGIGGSILGPKTMYYGLKNLSKRKRKAYFISNIDPDETASVLNKINIEKTLFVVVSKSGTTLETVVNEIIIRKELVAHNLDPSKQLISVTAKGSKMDDTSKYREVFYIWDYIGGRFSSTSMVGGVLLSFINSFEEYMQFLEGANKMDKIALSEDMNENIPLIMALISIWNRNFLNYPTLGLIPYSSMLSPLIPLLEQIEMESNGKSIDKDGKKIGVNTCPIVWGDVGTNAQHSFFQYLHQGSDISPLLFIGFEKSQLQKDEKIENTTSQQKLLSNLFAQAIALAQGQKNEQNYNENFEGDRPSSILLFEKLTPFALGSLISLFEHRAAFEGFIWDINSFDQEGVQLGKVLAGKITDLFAEKESNFEIGKALIDQLGIV